jgi:hypothetical protein
MESAVCRLYNRKQKEGKHHSSCLPGRRENLCGSPQPEESKSRKSREKSEKKKISGHQYDKRMSFIISAKFSEDSFNKVVIPTNQTAERKNETVSSHKTEGNYPTK